jgi:hypothetical protein
MTEPASAQAPGSKGPPEKEIVAVPSSSRLAAGQLDSLHISQLASAQSLISDSTLATEKCTKHYVLSGESVLLRLEKNLMRIAQYLMESIPGQS